MKLNKDACPKCKSDCIEDEFLEGWFTCVKCGKRWPRFALDHAKVEQEKYDVSNAIDWKGK
jgi:transcription initiation factor TFIIIB Brf1 subunit/transcription initiation factor TFIIB